VVSAGPGDAGSGRIQHSPGTGGPAFRIVGRLDEHLEPETAVLEFQDWFTPWEPYVPASQAEEEALLWYAGLFYFGD